MKVNDRCVCGAEFAAEDGEVAGRRLADGSGTGYVMDLALGWMMRHEKCRTSAIKDYPAWLSSGQGFAGYVDFNPRVARITLQNAVEALEPGTGAVAISMDELRGAIIPALRMALAWVDEHKRPEGQPS